MYIKEIPSTNRAVSSFNLEMYILCLVLPGKKELIISPETEQLYPVDVEVDALQ